MMINTLLISAPRTTNDLTTTIAKGVSHLFGMDGGHVYIEVVVRVVSLAFGTPIL